MTVKIFAITHKSFNPPKSKLYIPLHAGRAQSKDLGFIGDNTGDNISIKNKYYGGLTGLYWIWKNFNDTEYVGICSYRKFFINKNGKFPTENDYINILSEYDIIVSRSHYETKSYSELYSLVHNPKDLLALEKIIKEYYHDYYSAFLNVINGNKLHFGNIFCTSKKLLSDYCKWLFEIFHKLESVLNVEGYDDYQKRVFSFLSEELLMVWIIKNKLKYYECAVGYTQEKIETIELKDSLRSFVANRDIHKAKEFFYHTLEKRPDIAMSLSDIKNELQTMIQVIHTCEQEIKLNTPCMLDYSADLDKLVNHHHQIKNIIYRIYNNEETEFDMQYIISTNASWIEFTMIIINDNIFKSESIHILNKIAMELFNRDIRHLVIPLFEQSLGMDEHNFETLTNLSEVLNRMGETKLADEYKRKLFTVVST